MCLVSLPIYQSYVFLSFSPRKKSELQFPMGAVANVAVVGDGVTDNCHLSKFTPLEQSNEYLVESPPPSYTSATA